MDDIAIVELLNKRDKAGLIKLSRKYSHLILKICREILSSAEDAEECANDTLLAVWDGLEKERPENLKAYICKIARRRAVDKLRYNRAAIRDSTLLTEFDECLPSHGSAEGAAEMAELSKELNNWIRGLPEKQRTLFTLRYFYMYSVKNAAEQCSMSQTAASTALSRLRGSLKKYLIERGMYNE